MVAYTQLNSFYSLDSGQAYPGLVGDRIRDVRSFPVKSVYPLDNVRSPRRL